MTTEAQAHIGREIDKHILSLRDLRTRWNTLSPIHSLPSEMLETIFIHCACGVYEELRPKTDVPSWVNVSYVCRHWRDVALNSPTLWTYHFVASPRWTEELLARSRRAPLKIFISFLYLEYTSWWPSLVEKLMNHAERIQELRLDLVDTNTHKILPKFSSRAPSLRRLEIVGNHCYTSESSEWFPFPQLFAGDTPALRLVKLTHCPVLWCPLGLTDLTTLSLHRIPVLNIEQLLPDTLRRNLTRLYLCISLPSARELISSTGNFQKIDLPHLSRLLIIGQLATVIAFLSCVNVPLKTEIRLEFYAEHEFSSDNYALLPPLLAPRFGMPKDHEALSSPVVHSLVVDCTLGWDVGAAFSTLKCDCGPFVPISEDSDEHWDSNILLKIVVHAGQANNGNSIMSGICCSLPLEAVESVHVIYPPFSPTLWKKLVYLPGLRYIKLSHGSVLALDSVLALSDNEDVENVGGPATGDPDPDHRDCILAPEMVELELHDILLSPCDGGVLKRFVVTRRRLSDALSTRKVPRCPINGQIDRLVGDFDQLSDESDE